MSTKTFAVDRFLGLNLSEHGSTALKLGEAAKAENFYITDDRKLKTRPGVDVFHYWPAGGPRLALWQGMLGGVHCVVTVEGYRCDEPLILPHRAYITVITQTGSEEKKVVQQIGNFTDEPVKIFPLGDRIYIIGTNRRRDAGILLPSAVYCSIYAIAIENGEPTIVDDDLYAPVILTGRSPDGANSEALEKLNIMTETVRIQCSADGEAKDYILPKQVSSVTTVTVDGAEVSDGSYSGNTYTFASAPAKGVNNVEFLCEYSDSDRRKALDKFRMMPHCEAYNGATDARLFFYGDGSNVCYYTGEPAFGSGLYIPAGNEIAIDSSASAITGMRRHYTRLMAFKADSAFSISYEPQTLADGSVIAGFMVRPASRDVGNDMNNQIQTVSNYPRTLCGGSLYEWRHTASFYQDERYAKRIGQQVAPLLRGADPTKVVTCDDDSDRTYYMFLNDESGTVLVNRYELDAWTVYTGEIFRNIRFADAFHGHLFFANDECVYCFDANSAFDRLNPIADPVPIVCQYESGYMAFGADYLRKHSSLLWVSMLPQASSQMSVTVKTDRSDEYMVKFAGRPLLDFSAVDFSNYSFLISRAPKIQRTKLKVKKFVYYKLIFRVDVPGARATVLGYDQEVRFASHVK